VTLTELFAPAFSSRADMPALEFRGRSYTFADIDRRSRRVARWLGARGFRAGDRLAVYSENRVEFIDLFLACARTGVIFLPINILYRGREVSHIVTDAEPRAIVASGGVPEQSTFIDVAEVADVAEVEGQTMASPAADREGGSGFVNDVALASDSPLAIVYTSGTTGTAKGAILTHGNFAANARSLVDAWRFTTEDRLLLPLPLFHVHGLGNGVGCWLASGCRMRLLERFEQDKAAADFLSFQPTVLFAVPTIYVRLLGWPVDTAREIGRQMRLFVSGSAPLPAHVHDAFRERFGHAILERYGMTETFMNVSNPYDGDRRAGTVGFPLPGVEVRIITEDGRAAAADEPGEVQIRGDNVFAGYWGRETATRAAFVDGWFKTGDIGVRSADGYISLRGRATDLIISGGFNIYPREIEEVILEAPGVREAVVVGAGDPLRGEVPVAYIAAGETFDEAALVEHLRKSLASFKMPRAFVRVERLPRTALGKVQKHLLPPWQA
jgi:malonyl-CoA/methylmalonyl-CoA synthetase